MTPLQPFQAHRSARRPAPALPLGRRHRPGRPALAAFAAGVTLAVAACSSVSSYAATVDGTRIGTGTLENELRNIASNDKYLKFVESKIQAPVRTNGVFDASFTSSVLSQEIIYDVIEKDLARRKIVVAPQDMASARTAASERVSGDDVFNAFPKSYQDTLTRRNAQVTLLVFALLGQGSPDVVSKAFYDANQDAFSRACVSGIVVASEDDANKVKARLDGGEDFATVANSASTDTASASKGGDLGCFEKQDQLQPDVAKAMFSQPVGMAGPPVKSQFGFQVFLVKSRDVAPYEKVADQAREQAAAAAAPDTLGKWLDDAVNKANISVNPKYGRWDKQGAQSRVIPPEAPTTKAGPGGSDQTPPTSQPG